MTDVLHVQTRAYPLHYSTASLVTDTVTVPGYGTYRLRVGSLRSQAYNHDHTIEADLTDLVQAVVTLPGVEILACRARFLTSGTVLLVYALRHRVALRDLDTQALANYDAEINDALRSADSAVLGAAFDAAAAAGVVGGLTIRPGSAEELWPSGVGRNEVRYNCHFVVRRPAWRSDPRVPELVRGPACHILLPYTYAWDADPDLAFDDLLTMLEPADIAVAQLSLLFSAMVNGRQTLADLSRAALGRYAPTISVDFWTGCGPSTTGSTSIASNPVRSSGRPIWPPARPWVWSRRGSGPPLSSTTSPTPWRPRRPCAPSTSTRGSTGWPRR